GSAQFSIDALTGFRMQTFKVTDFAVFGFDPFGGAPGNNAAPATPSQAALLFPTADLASPVNGKAVLASSLTDGTGTHIDVTFNDVNGAGLNEATILDNAQEFELQVNGAAVTGLTINGAPTKVSGK